MTFKFNVSPQSRELIDTALSWSEQGVSIALVTLVAIEGNAPYPMGSQMLVSETGEFIGQITGGCAEVAIADQARLAIKAKQNATVRYGLDSPYFDIKLPCGSGVDVYFDVGLSTEILRQIHSQLSSRQAHIQSLDTTIGKVDKCYRPTPRLVVAGQGPILQRLTELATRTGFDVACISQNSATKTLLKAAGFNSNSITSLMKVSDQQKLIDTLDRYSAFVSVFHEHEFEVPLIQSALKSKAFYIGALGSRKTHAARCEALCAKGVTQQQLDRVYGPVGIDIGADTPAQIAISILSQVIQQMNRSSSYHSNLY